jgi:hypothetical protein
MSFGENQQLTEFSMKLVEIRSYCESKLSHLQSLCGDQLIVSMSEKKDRVTITVDNDKGTISLKNFWDDETTTDFDKTIVTIENDIAESISLGCKMPKPKHKPMFSAEEIFIAIASENS